MTTETDKLVEMAQAAGFTAYNGSIYCHENNVTKLLAAFRAAVIADLAADVEPVYGAVANGEPLYSATTVAALKARVAVLEESASQFVGVDLDGMVEAFHRIIDSQAQQSPFHNPVNADAALALRELRRLIPAIKAVALTKGQP